MPTTVEQGYVTMADGTDLAYTVVRHTGDGPFPTLFEYSGYNPGRSPDDGYIDRCSSCATPVTTPTWA